MTRDHVLTWLAARRPTPPQALAAHLAAVVRDAPDPLPEHLALLGQELLARVTAAPGGRELALDLLAADAFVTYAFEAQAEVAVSELGGLARRIAEDAATAR